MGTTFTDHIRVRGYECDLFGHVNNAVYIQYLQQVTLDAFSTAMDGDAFWNARRLSIEYQYTRAEEHRPIRHLAGSTTGQMAHLKTGQIRLTRIHHPT